MFPPYHFQVTNPANDVVQDTLSTLETIRGPILFRMQHIGSVLPAVLLPVMNQ